MAPADFQRPFDETSASGPKDADLPLLGSVRLAHDRLATRYSNRYTRAMVRGEWQIYLANEVRNWLDDLEPASHNRVVQAIDALAEAGPSLGRPLVDTIHGSSISNLKELRPGNIRILFVFDPWRSSILLVAGDKSGQWNAWYAAAIPLAEQRYERYLKERTQEEDQQ